MQTLLQVEGDEYFNAYMHTRIWLYIKMEGAFIKMKHFLSPIVAEWLLGDSGS